MTVRPRHMLILLFFCWLTTAADAAEPFARATIETKGPIVSGEQIYVYVDVFAPNYFTSPPQFPLFDIPNAVVTLTDQRAQNLIETIDGISYAGIRETYAVVPETSGSFALPPAAITFRYAAEPGKSLEGSAAIPATSFSVTDAAGAPADTINFAAAGLTLQQSFDRDLKSMKIGDALVRSVTIFAENTQSMMIPVPAFDAPAGMSLYAKPPVLQDNVTAENSRDSGSSRLDRVTYVANDVGRFTIPPLTISWFDTVSRSAKVATLDAVTIDVAAAPTVQDGIAPDLAAPDVPASASWFGPLTWLIVGALAALALLIAAAVKFYPALVIAAQRRHAARTTSEPYKFRRLMAALKSEEAAAAYSALEDWTRCLGYRSITNWVDESGDDELNESWDVFDRQLFEGPAKPVRVDTERLARSISRLRRSHKGPAGGSAPDGSALPQLNPQPRVKGSRAV